MERPWVDKYRPRKVQDVSHQPQVVGSLKHTLENKQFANMLFYGPPGTGKTTAALALCHELYGTHYDQLVTELNASDQRGIDVVRSKIKQVASYAVNPSGDHPSFKIIILDEADQMTVDAQNALRRMMEVYQKQTRFIMICNYVSKIIPALVSRCAAYRFQPLPQEAVQTYIHRVCKSEGVTLSPQVIKVLNEVSGGDLRRATNLLQSAVRVKGKEINDSQVLYDVAGWIPRSVMLSALEVCQKGQFQQVVDFCYKTINEAYSTSQVVVQLQKQMFQCDINDMTLADVSLLLGRVKSQLIDGANQNILLLDLLCQLWRILRQNQN
eukprot:TRINITY_DN4065_c0_g1_i5.p1 TRINITY_DN4065_c0_g1~~TRINITY_DN4065_c0_g1_i5.p1  ORF type:complete len:369 (-),score=38.32 TRINITY_DN4065_c0_g1_i5:161-1135(-)